MGSIWCPWMRCMRRIMLRIKGRFCYNRRPRSIRRCVTIPGSIIVMTTWHSSASLCRSIWSFRSPHGVVPHTRGRMSRTSRSANGGSRRIMVGLVSMASRSHGRTVLLMIGRDDIDISRVSSGRRILHMRAVVRCRWWITSNFKGPGSGIGRNWVRTMSIVTVGWGSVAVGISILDVRTSLCSYSSRTDWIGGTENVLILSARRIKHRGLIVSLKNNFYSFTHLGI